MSHGSTARASTEVPRTSAEGYDRSVAASPFDKIAYLFAMVGLYVMVGAVHRHDSQLRSRLVIITMLEGIVFLLVLASVATMECRPSRRKPFVLSALAMALLVFGLLAFGQSATAQHESVATLYGYFDATVIIMLLVRTLPPYSSDRWLG